MNENVVRSSLHAQFLALLPRIETHARIHFRDVVCSESKADCVAESIAIAWKWFLRLTELGKDINGFPMAFAFYVARAVRCGRRVCGQDKAGDVLSPVAQRKHGFRAERLSAVNSNGDEQLGAHSNDSRPVSTLEERLIDNTVTPPDEQAMFRIDFADWLRTLTEREKSIIAMMSGDEPTKDVARRFGVTPGRISQMRRVFQDHWVQFCGDELPATNAKSPTS